MSAGRTDLPEHMWDRFRTAWHALVVVVVLFVCGLVLAKVSTGTGRAVACGALAVFLVWYAFAGRAAFRHQAETDRYGLIYLVGAAALLNAVYWETLAGAFMLFAVSGHIFQLLHRRRHRVIVVMLFYGQAAGWTFYREGSGRHAVVDVVATILVPMVFAILIGAYIGAIIAQSRRRAGLIEELTRTRAELAAERHQAGVRDERVRLSAEIHDTLAQGFTSILMLAQAARVGLGRDRAATERQLDLLERTARDNLAEARALVAATSPPDLADRSLAEALVRIAERHTHDTGVTVNVEVDGEPAGEAADVDVVLLRAAQEALSNVRRHADASAVRIVLSRRDGCAALAITDDGRGFAPETTGIGFGLPGLRSRALAFGGVCIVESAPGAGTTVRVELPA